jgi:hypothetical protein
MISWELLVFQFVTETRPLVAMNENMSDSHRGVDVLVM